MLNGKTRYVQQPWGRVLDSRNKQMQTCQWLESARSHASKQSDHRCYTEAYIIPSPVLCTCQSTYIHWLGNESEYLTCTKHKWTQSVQGQAGNVTIDVHHKHLANEETRANHGVSHWGIITGRARNVPPFLKQQGDASVLEQVDWYTDQNDWACGWLVCDYQTSYYIRSQPITQHEGGKNDTVCQALSNFESSCCGIHWKPLMKCNTT